MILGALRHRTDPRPKKIRPQNESGANWSANQARQSPEALENNLENWNRMAENGTAKPIKNVANFDEFRAKDPPMTFGDLSTTTLDLLRNSMKERDTTFASWLDHAMGDELERRRRNGLGDEKDLRNPAHELPAELTLPETLSVMKALYASLLSLEMLSDWAADDRALDLADEFHRAAAWCGQLLAELRQRLTLLRISTHGGRPN